MTIRLLLKKKFRKLITSSKGFSSVIGTVFMVLVMMFLSTSVFLWTLSQNTMYNEAVRARNQEEIDRDSENVVATDGIYSVSGDEVTVNATLTNAGSVAVQIINLWVADTTIQRYNNTITSLNINLNPEDSSTVSTVVTIPGTGQDHEFNSWFVTARGNTIYLEKKFDLASALASQVGSLVFNFVEFRYYTYASGNKLQNYPSGVKSYNLPPDTLLAFGTALTNVDPDRRTMTIDSHSLIWIPDNVRSAAVHQGKRFYVVNVASDGTIAGTFTDIAIEYGESVLVIFASSSDGSFSSGTRIEFESNPWSGNTVSSFIMLHGTFDSSPYGQNIPFVALYITS